jgi:hypothetical protein
MKIYKEWIIIPALAVGCAYLSACSWRIESPSAIDAYTRQLTSLMKTPKETAQEPNQYFALDIAREKEKTARELEPSWLQNLVSGGTGNVK